MGGLFAGYVLFFFLIAFRYTVHPRVSLAIHSAAHFIRPISEARLVDLHHGSHVNQAMGNDANTFLGHQEVMGPIGSLKMATLTNQFGATVFLGQAYFLPLICLSLNGSEWDLTNKRALTVDN